MRKLLETRRNNNNINSAGTTDNLVDRESKPEGTIPDIRGVQIDGAYKPRTSPYSFRGLKEQGWQLLVLARAETGLPVVTEAMDPRQVILCQRGIRTFETATRNTLDLNAVPVLKKRTHLPVIVDPSHGTGHWWMVPWLAKGAIAVGADGLLVEVHCNPQEALSDGPQCASGRANRHQSPCGSRRRPSPAAPIFS